MCQLTNGQGQVTLANAYDPYGVLAQTAGSAQTSYGFTGEFTDPSGMVYLRARYYSPSDGRFLTRDTWMGEYNRPLSLNRWMYVEGNPVNLTDPSGHDPYWCQGRTDEKLCIARWKLSRRYKLYADDLEAIYKFYPDETLNYLQQEFGIQLPAGYQFRLASGSSEILQVPFWESKEILGASFWFAEINLQNSSILELSGQCSVFLFDDSAHTTHIDYSVYISDKAFTEFDFHPDDVAGTMIHEAVHAWQESLVRDNLDVYLTQFNRDPRSSFSWISTYKNGMERQAIDMTLWAYEARILRLSEKFIQETKLYRTEVDSGWNSPISIPVRQVVTK